MKDYRLLENRGEYFDKLYSLNLVEGIMPGLIYKYFPALKQHFNWGAEESLWFAFLNGMTQNPLTSLRIYEHLPEPPRSAAQLDEFGRWFNEVWDTLQFDTDRRYQKKDTVYAIGNYIECIKMCGSQEAMLTNKSYDELWNFVRDHYASFGRLSTFSYLEYVKVMGYGAECTDLLFNDLSGSRSHRNGMLLLLGKDNFVHDKRMPNGFAGKYEDFKGLCEELKQAADAYLETCLPHKDAGYFTLESQCCTYKNHFFGRRYPGVYADMAYERLMWYENAVGRDKNSKLLWEIRGALPKWLRQEVDPDGLTIKQRAAVFPERGFPYRGEYFL